MKSNPRSEKYEILSFLSNIYSEQLDVFFTILKILLNSLICPSRLEKHAASYFYKNKTTEHDVAKLQRGLINISFNTTH